VQLHQHIGCNYHYAGEGQQSVALPPKLISETQLQIDISMALQGVAKISHCSDSFDNAPAPTDRA
jgi:hypothetical protein